LSYAPPGSAGERADLADVAALIGLVEEQGLTAGELRALSACLRGGLGWLVWAAVWVGCLGVGLGRLVWVGWSTCLRSDRRDRSRFGGTPKGPPEIGGPFGKS